MYDAQTMLRHWESQRSCRSTYDAQCNEIARYIWPEQEEFFGQAWHRNNSNGSEKRIQIYDPTASQALVQYAALVASLIAPAHQRYMSLVSDKYAANEDRDVALYFEKLTDRLFAARYAPNANFEAQLDDALMSVGAFGNGCLFVDDVLGKRGIRYKSVPFRDVWVDVNHQGQVDTVFRRFDYSNHQAMQRGWFETLPADFLRKAEKDPYGRDEWLHVVMPSKKQKDGFSAKNFLSFYVHVKSKQIVEEGGYGTMPYIFFRDKLFPFSNYGYGPASRVLPTIRLLNRMERTDLRTREKLADPPILTPDFMFGGNGGLDFRMDPSSMNPGYVTSDGRPLALPFLSGARVDLTVDKQQYYRSIIRDEFLVNLFQILVETPRMTATEALIRAQEKGALLGGIKGRLESELLGPLTLRELEVMADSGMLDDLPQPAQVKDFDIRYDSPLSRMIESEKVVGVQRTIEMATQIAQYDPTVFDWLDGKVGLDVVAKASAAPIAFVRSREAVEADRQARAQQEAGAVLPQQAAQSAKALKDLAQAQQISQQI